MSRIRKIALILLFVAAATNSFGQRKARSWNCPVPNGPILEREVCDSNIKLDSTDIASLVMTSLSSTEAPGGVSLSFNFNSDILYSFKPVNMNLRGVFNSIVAAAPEYEWKEDNGVINLHPSNDYSLLDTRIAEFNVEKATKGRLLAELKESTEFKEALIENNLSEFPLIMGSFLSPPPNLSGLPSPPPNMYSVHLKNATVREILNEIVRQNGRSTWLYQEYTSDWIEKNKRYYNLTFLVDHS
jgi:hypothetical protein